MQTTVAGLPARAGRLYLAREAAARAGGREMSSWTQRETGELSPGPVTRHSSREPCSAVQCGEMGRYCYLVLPGEREAEERSPRPRQVTVLQPALAPGQAEQLGTIPAVVVQSADLVLATRQVRLGAGLPPPASHSSCSSVPSRWGPLTLLVTTIRWGPARIRT